MSAVEVARIGATTWIRLNRPERANACSADLVEGLLAAVTGAIQSDARMLVLSGAGGGFCGGFDLAGLDVEGDASLAYRFLRIEQLLQTVYYAPLYTMALAQGNVVGAGADLVAVCASRIAAPGATFRFPGLRFGVVLGNNRLTDLVGDRARALVLEQETVGVAEAERIGLIGDIAEPSEWEALVSSTEARVTSLAPAAVRSVMQLAQSSGGRDLGILARSVLGPGLKERMQSYWREARAARAGNNAREVR